MSIDYCAIGRRIKKYRVDNKLTQAKLSEISSVEPSNISHIERGATKLSFPTLLKIANALGVTLDDLVYDNLSKNSYISIKEINELLSDCSDNELKSIAEMIRSTKAILRNKTID